MGNVADEYTLMPLSPLKSVSLHFSGPHVTWGGPAMKEVSTAAQSQRHRLLDPRSGQFRRGDQHRHGPAARPHRTAGQLRRRLDPSSSSSASPVRPPSTPVTCNGRASPLASTARSTTTSPAATPGRTSSRPTTAAPRSTCWPIRRPSAAASRPPCRWSRTSRARPACRSSRRSSFQNFDSATGKVSSISGTALGVRAPDIVASLDVTQSWGGAHLAGVAHNDRTRSRGAR